MKQIKALEIEIKMKKAIFDLLFRKKQQKSYTKTKMQMNMIKKLIFLNSNIFLL